MRGLIPLDIHKMTLESLQTQGLPEPIAQRLLQVKTLSMINMHHDDISKVVYIAVESFILMT
jgi:hypothetical protein